MKHTLRCLAATLALPLVALTAQDTSVVQSGSRVRITYNPSGRHFERVVGTLESIDSAFVVVRDNEGRISFPREASTQLDVSAGPGACSGGRRGGCVAIGFFGGAGLGALAGLISTQSQGGASTCECGIIYLLTVPAGALVGTIVGALVGGEHWKSAPLPARLSVGPDGSGRFAVGLSSRF